MEEEKLIQHLREKKEPAYRFLVDTYGISVYNTVFNILQDEDEADDTAQEVFIKVYHSIAQFKQDSSLRTWLYRIAVRKAMDKLRQRRNRKRLQSLIPWWMPNDEKLSIQEFVHPGIALEHKEKAAALFSAINKLPENQKIAFNLIKVQGMKYDEVCTIMQQSTKAVESLVMRAKKNLQKLLVHHQDF